MKPLSRTILETVAYYDVMGFPLTAFEVWKYLMTADDGRPKDPVGLGEVCSTLGSEDLRRHVSSSRGMYCLHGREHLVERRLARLRRSVAYTKQVRRIGRMLRFVPFVRMIGLTGSVAMRNARKGSDWDLFIVLASGHIWLGRLLVSGILQLSGKRRHGKHVHERACLNFWVTSDSLEIPFKDLFSSHEYVSLVPIYGPEEYRRFRSENAWIRRFRPQYSPTRLISLWCLADTSVSFRFRRAGEWLLAALPIERPLGRLQQAKIARNPKTHLPGSAVIADDRMLIFLPKPHGPRVFEKFKRRLAEAYPGNGPDTES